MKQIVDASVAIKWAVDEDLRSQARSLLQGTSELLAPDFIAVEIGNVLWKKVKRGEISALQARAALPVVTNAFSRLVPVGPFATRALELAIELAHPVYDCLYLATAEAEGASLVTADLRLLDVLRGTRFEALAISLRHSAP